MEEMTKSANHIGIISVCEIKHAEFQQQRQLNKTLVLLKVHNIDENQLSPLALALNPSTATQLTGFYLTGIFVWAYIRIMLHFYTPWKNLQKTEVFWCFQGV